MWYEWLIFAIVFLLIPIAVANLKLIAEKRINPTEEQKKNANLFCGFLMLFYWLCDLFYMAFILDSLALKFVFGSLIMLIIFYNLSKAFISGASHFKWGLIQDFVVGVGMSIYLIYIIPCDDLREVVIPVVSAVYGGLITLVGVVLTIRETRKDIAKRDALEAKPFFGISEVSDNDLSNEQNKSLTFISQGELDFIVSGSSLTLCFHNSNKVEFMIDKFIIDGLIYLSNSSVFIDKEASYLLNFKDGGHQIGDKDIYMEITDTNYNKRTFMLQHKGMSDYIIKEIT